MCFLVFANLDILKIGTFSNLYFLITSRIGSIILSYFFCDFSEHFVQFLLELFFKAPGIKIKY